jgi:hypothetical protein
MLDSEDIKMCSPDIPDTQNKQKYPFFGQDNFALLVNVTIHSNENCKEWMTFVLKNCLLMQLAKMLETKIHTAYKNCTPILAHHFNSCVYQSHR